MPPVVNRKERKFAVGLFASSNRIRTCSPLVSSSKRPPAQQVARRVSYVDTETNKHLVFLTNNFDLAALTITQIYKCRWQVELFFKWIKQHLRIKAFYVTSENAVKTQIWVAVSVYVLVAIVRKRLTLEASLYQILQILSVTLFRENAHFTGPTSIGLPRR